MKTILCTITVVLPLFALLNADRYCNGNRCAMGNRDHTMCKYPSLMPGSMCGVGIESMGFTPEEKVAVVNKHNELRMFVASGKERRGSPGPQPKAINMNLLKWDDELATVAQAWANQCTFRHDRCRDVSRFAVGQNIGIQSTTGVNNSNATMIIAAWYNEVKDFDRKQVSRLTVFQNVGHYTQLVWAQTLFVGCGQIRYETSYGWNEYYLVCNYGPAGNVYRAAVYKTPD